MNQAATFTSTSQFNYELSALDSTIYRRFQHASLHNPIHNAKFNLRKKLDVNKQNSDPFFRNSTKYKLPELRSTFRSKITMNIKNKTKNDVQYQKQKQKKKKDAQSQSQPKLVDMQNEKSKNSTIVQIIESANSTNRQSSHQIQNYHKQLTKKFKINVQKCFKNNEKDQCFSYNYKLTLCVLRIIEENELKQQILQNLLSDVQLITQCIDKNRSVVNTIKKIAFFRKNSSYFQFKRSQIRIIFHIFLAQLQIYQQNFEKSTLQLQFCQYYSRKQPNLQSLTMCFLWQICNINISLLKYQQADINIRNALQMAVLSKNKKAIKYLFQKISMIYYYRGNSIMGQYYLNKSEQGLSAFQLQIYIRQYSKQDQLSRLEHILFNFPVIQQTIKRKNNPKFQFDVWRQSKQEYKKSANLYMQSVNKMLKDHQFAKAGRNIKKIVNNLSFISEVKTIKKELIQNRSSQFIKNDKMVANGTTHICKTKMLQKQPKLQKNKMNEMVQENITKVIKSHLSLNRQNNRQSKQIRWRKFVQFLFLLQSEFKYILQENNKKVSFVA